MRAAVLVIVISGVGVRGGMACVPIILGDGVKPPGTPGYWLRSGFIGPDLLKLPRKLDAYH